MDNLRRRTSNTGRLRGSVSGSDAQASDVVFSKNDGSELVIISGQENWPDASEYTPIGIVVVPGTHNRYGDGTCGIMSLVGMDNNHPESGIIVTRTNQKDNVLLYWGYGANKPVYVFTGEYAVDYNDEREFQGYIYSQYIYGENAGRYYVGSTGSTVYDAEFWPYTIYQQQITGYCTDISNNGSYVTETTGMGFCDFNGIRNTAMIYIQTQNNKQWSSNTVPIYYYYQSNYSSYTPAAACVGRFKTLGTKSFIEAYSSLQGSSPYNAEAINYGTANSTKENTGFWYFPAMGELTYVPPIVYPLRTTIDALNQKYGKVATVIYRDSTDTTATGWYLSSSLSQDDNNCFGVSFNGQFSKYAKDSSQYFVRAFMRL